MNDETPAPIGHNRPPVTISDGLAERHKPFLDRFGELIPAAKAAPEEIRDDETHKKVVDLLKQIRDCKAKGKAARDVERAPFQRQVNEVNGFFDTRIDELEKWRHDLNIRHTHYAEEKAAKEKKRLAEEAEKRRRAQEEALALAEAAQRTKLEAEAGRREAERMAEFAAQQKADATTAVQVAQAKITEAKANEAKAAAEILAIDAEIARQKQAGVELESKETFEARKAIFREAIQTIRGLRSKAETELRAAKDAEAAARRETAEAEARARAAKQVERTAARDGNAALETAMREERRADKLEAKAAGPEADLARTRTGHGAVGTLQRRWICSITDRDALDRDALWPHINGDALQAALWKWMMAQAPEARSMPGAIMQEEVEGQVR